MNPESTFPTVEPWRSREEILQEHLDSLTLDEFRRERPSYYWRRYGLPAWERECARKYDPNQPRVPAGNPDGGQWASVGGSSDRSSIDDNPSKVVLDRVLLADAGGHARSSDVLSDANPAPIVPGARYAEVSVSRFDRTGDPRIDKTTETLMQTLGRAHTSVGEGAGPVYGIMVHSAFGADVKRQNIPGIGQDGVEQSFSLNDTARYGLDGSIRTDVVLRDPQSPDGSPIAIWDVKTGGARLSGSRVSEIREHVGVGSDVPVIELHITRGVTKKGRTIAGVVCAFIAAQRW